MLVCRLLVVFAVALCGCSSGFPPGSLEWGHGATPLDEGQSRVQVGAGAGVGYGVVGTSTGDAVVNPIAGAGGGLGVERQLSADVAVRAEFGGGCQSSVVKDGAPLCPVAGYLGGQLNPRGSRTLALRVLAGGGADVVLSTPLPYAAGVGAVVFSADDDGLERYADVHLGLKLGLLTGTPVGNAGAAGGLRYSFTDVVSVYGALRADILLANAAPALTGTLQLGALFRF